MSEHWFSLSTKRWRPFSRLSDRAATPLNPFHLALGLATAVLIGLGSPAHAQIFWQDDDYYPDVYIEAPPPPPPARREPHRAKRHSAAKSETAAKAARKPKGPLLIAISIHRQTLKIYDANGFFAETPISTGMPGHSTPLGVFSVIQKQKWHRSNIYSGAPMPYMQRITWSGIAMHAGVLPGHPASHGCIRMPMSFAVKMWGWTRVGARVIVTPGEVMPAEFSHPMLMTHRPEPASVAAKLRTADASGAMPQVAALSVTADTPAAVAENATTEIKSATTGLPETGPAGSSVHTSAPDQASRLQTATTEPAVDPIKTDAGNAKDDDVSTATAVKPDGDKERKLQTAESAIDVPAPVTDQSQSPASAITEPVATPALKRTGRIAVFISRKDSKIYVRQNFAPLFDAPITITASDRPFGTHVFTAEADRNSQDHFHWSVVSLPMMHGAEQVSVRANGSPRRRIIVPVASRPTPVPDSAADALDRISIPEDVMTKIAESLSAGDSIIVSDQGIAGGGETGEGTDFIVRLR
ncbi:MAG: L,D-transpeptidase family protein [Nitrobacter sp.]